MNSPHANILLVICLFLGHLQASSTPNSTEKNTVNVNINLQNIKDDMVEVVVTFQPLKTTVVTFRFPKIIPGTYSIADYGRYIESFNAYSVDGKLLEHVILDSNTYIISGANNLSKVSYWVNDTYDREISGDVFSADSRGIFSPAGSNIVADTQFMLNLAAFVGYIDELQEKQHILTINHPSRLYGATALTDTDPSMITDVFNVKRYAEVVDNPIMYAAPDTASFTVDGMQVLLGLYAPNKNTNAGKLLPALKKTIQAQKRYLGPLNTTKKYAVLVYLTTMLPEDAKGVGALEHNNSTVGIFREAMSSEDLVNVISHEFFHTVTPLKVHSEEIHYFNFAKPAMSKHLWFYEGVTEYFAHLFQVNQGIISENAFFDVMAQKEESAREYNDSLSFLEMSKNILDPNMKSQYPNVYQKGPMIAMCIDIMLREKSNGKKGIEDLIYTLSQKYGADHPFKDGELLPEITSLTYPEVGAFLDKHLQKGKTIDYAIYLAKVGLVRKQVPTPELSVFMHNDNLYIDVDDEKKQVIVNMPDTTNKFFNGLGLQNRDVLVSINGLRFNTDDGGTIILLGNGLQEGDMVEMKIQRGGTNKTIKTAVRLNYTDGPGYRFVNTKKQKLKDSWLKKSLN